VRKCEASQTKFTGPKRGRFPETDDAVHVFSRETQDWTVYELWSTSRGGDKEGHIFEHSSKSF